jgi:outer membrane protein assembly factor BamB
MIRHSLWLFSILAILGLVTAVGTNSDPSTQMNATPLDKESAPIAQVDRLFATTSISTDFIIAEIDPTTGSVLNTFDAPVNQGVSDGLAFDGVNLYYLSGSWDANTLYVLNPNDGTVRTTHQLPASAFRNGLAYLNGFVYILDWSVLTQDITIFDPASGVVVGTLDINGTNPGAPAISGGLAGITEPDALLVTTSTTNEMLEINPVSGVISNTFAHGRNGTLGVAVANGQIYLGANTSDILQIYSRNGNLQGTVTVPDSIGFQSLGGDDVACPEDVDGSGQVNIRDIQSVAGGLGGPDLTLDVNGDGQINILDLRQVAFRWLPGCP